MLLFHGTTLWRARRVLRDGPDPDFVEPGGDAPAENFTACLTFGPFEASHRPEDYALGKAEAAICDGRDGGGAAILILDVPDEVIALAVDEYLPLSQGFVQFDRGSGLEALLAVWPQLPKRIISFTGATS